MMVTELRILINDFGDGFLSSLFLSVLLFGVCFYNDAYNIQRPIVN
jgi:hypothetical protein